MKSTFILIGLFLLFFFSCSKKGQVVSPSGNDRDSTQNQDSIKQKILIEQALFTSPNHVKTDSKDPIIINHLIKYFNFAPKGSSVYMSIARLNDESLEHAIYDAYSRGVEIHIIIDYSVEGNIKGNASTISFFKKFFTPPSELILMRSDLHELSLDHEKYVIFSELDLPQRGIAKNVIFATSHNFYPAGENKVNDAVVMSNKGLYDAFLKNWNALAPLASGGMDNFTYQTLSVGDSIVAIFFPRIKNGKWDGFDTIVEQLDSLSNFSKDTVRVMMSGWSRGSIAEKLIDLQNKGVTVQIIGKKTYTPGVLTDLQTLHEFGGYVKILDEVTQNLHSKCMLIKGVFNGKKQTVILTGSHNYTVHALKYNNEFLLKLKNSTLFKDYWNYFNDLQNALSDFSGWGD